MTLRDRFEARYSRPPYEWNMDRNSMRPDISSFPGQYRDYHVQCAWEAYQAAMEDAAEGNKASRNPLLCECEETYSIEKHGDGHVIYYGRCPHKHGYNLATLTELSYNCDISRLEDCLIRGDLTRTPIGG